ncbi:MAG: hypothetical protein IT360_15595 [Gemmatimonadaceae bacterium]|nr:hypothetical protein [Gemmatimonadaceae bacterium]
MADQFRLRQAMRALSILDELVEVDAADPDAIRARLVARRQIEVAHLFLEAVRRVGGAASTHLGLLKKYLEKPAHAEAQALLARHEELVAAGSPEAHHASLGAPETSMPAHHHVVDPTRGASGMNFPEVASIRAMRLNNARVRLLRQALEL